MKEKMIEIFDRIAHDAKSKGVAHLKMGAMNAHHAQMQIGGRELTNFAVCDYLGLSQDHRLKAGAIEAVKRFGTYLAVSRSFMQLDFAAATEQELSKVFDRPVALIARTTLGHVAALPVITHTKDAIILDHQVHTSVRNAADMLRGFGNKIRTVRHNRMDQLEDYINQLSKQHERVWYLADGIYSMFGDGLPASAMTDLLDRYEQLHLYVDDAHGMSWRGEHGKGYLLDSMAYHPRLFLSTSLGKGFGSGGAALICPNEETKQRIVNTGAPMVFTSPPDPAMLGAIFAATRIHVSDEIYLLQDALMDRIRYFQQLCLDLQLPLVDQTLSPIFYIGVGQPEVGYEMSEILMNEGFYLSLGVYPAVPYNNTGLRATIGLRNSKRDIEKLLSTIAKHLPKVLEKYNCNLEKLSRDFKKTASAA